VSLNAATAPVQVNGDFLNDGTLNVTVSGAAVAIGTYPLIRYTGSLTGSARWVCDAAERRRRYSGRQRSQQDDRHFGYDSLFATRLERRFRRLGHRTTANWTGIRTTYLDGDLVLFDDTSSGDAPFTVALSADVVPNNVLFNNSSKDYTLIGPGALSGDAGIYKEGSGR
jgi:hypothetical protein